MRSSSKRFLLPVDDVPGLGFTQSDARLPRSRSCTASPSHRSSTLPWVSPVLHRGPSGITRHGSPAVVLHTSETSWLPIPQDGCDPVSALRRNGRGEVHMQRNASAPMWVCVPKAMATQTSIHYPTFSTARQHDFSIGPRRDDTQIIGPSWDDTPIRPLTVGSKVRGWKQRGIAGMSLFLSQKVRCPSDDRPEFSAQHLANLAGTFTFQRFIELPEHRAITLEQLKTLLHFAKANCHMWHDLASSDTSQTSGQVLSMECLNLYHVNSWIIFPATKDCPTKGKNCAFVELLATREQRPDWFVSHWWGEPHEDFFKCLTLHAQLRNLSCQAAFWVCAYANRQHALANDVTDDPKQSSFFKALQSVDFHVLLILNDKTKLAPIAMPFQRIWCGFELAMCLDRARVSLDVAASCGSIATILLGGVSDKELALQMQNTRTGVGTVLNESLMLPLTIIDAGLTACLEKGRASVEADRIHILNCITGRDLNSEPLFKHSKYNEVNQRLRALFSLALWRQVMTSKEWQTEEIMEKLSRALSGDTTRVTLDMDLIACTAIDKSVFERFIGALCPNIRELKLDVRGSSTGDDIMEVLSDGLPGRIEDLVIDATGCSLVTDDGIDRLRLGISSRIAKGICCLKNVQLFLNGSRVSKIVQDRCKSLGGILTWEPIDADVFFSACWFGNVESCLEALIHPSFDINATNNENTTLQVAAKYAGRYAGLIDVCHTILQSSRFTCVNHQNTLGLTALHEAAGIGNVGVCNAILKHPQFSNVNAKNTEFGETALHLAAAGGHTGVCELIFAQPSFTEAKAKARKGFGDVGETAADVAEKNGHLDLAERIRALV